jgi:hypothetical protein
LDFRGFGVIDRCRESELAEELRKGLKMKYEDLSEMTKDLAKEMIKHGKKFLVQFESPQDNSEWNPYDMAIFMESQEEIEQTKRENNLKIIWIVELPKEG